MNTLPAVYDAIKTNHLRANNYVFSKALSVCVEFIEACPQSKDVPVDTTIMTISFMVNKTRKKAKETPLPTSDFKVVMGVFESALSSLYMDSDSTVDNELYFAPIHNQVKSWYDTLDCHRLFLIPTDQVFPAIERLFDRETIKRLYKHGLKRVYVDVDIESHESMFQFFI